MHDGHDIESRRPLIGYAKLIHDIDASVNPVGVECAMRLQFHNLDHLDWHTFHNEIALAKAIEAARPGELRRTAATYGRTSEFDAAQAYVELAHDAGVDERPPVTWWTHGDRLYVVNAERPFERPARTRAVAHGPIGAAEDEIAIRTLHEDRLPLSRIRADRIGTSTREYVIVPDLCEALQHASNGSAGTDAEGFEHWPTGGRNEPRYWLLSNAYRTSAWMAIEAAVSLEILPDAARHRIPALPVGPTLHIGPGVPTPPKPHRQCYACNPDDTATIRRALDGLRTDWALAPQAPEAAESETDEGVLRRIEAAAAELSDRHHPQMRVDVEHTDTGGHLAASLDLPMLDGFPARETHYWSMEHNGRAVTLRRTALRRWLWNAAHTPP